MNLIVPIKMMYGDVDCLICSTGIKVRDKGDSLRCGDCGAHYSLIAENVYCDDPNLMYEFAGHMCLHNNTGINLTVEERWCQEVCPTSRMYCKIHCADSYIDNARGGVSYSKGRVARAEELLDTLEESKKTWLIKELSGIDEDSNDTVPEDETG